MGNQQERFEIDLSWLAGILEGEGWVSLIVYKSNQKNGKHTLAFSPNIGITNTDMLIMGEVERLFKKIGLKYRYQVREPSVGFDGVARKKKAEISVISHQSTKILISSMFPYMVGEKKGRMLKLLEFFKIRALKPRSGPASKYGKEEMDLYLSMYSYKGKSRSKILNDYTPGPFGFERKDIV